MGGGRAPVSFLAARAPPELVAYLLGDPDGPFLPAASLEGWGFRPSPKDPFLLKADWHGVHGWGDQHPAFVPRMEGIQIARRAPPRIVAFLEAFREVNQPCWCRIVEGLEGLRMEAGQSSPELAHLAGLYLEALRSRGHFGAVEAQVLSAHGRRRIGSHKDGATALLHLGLTLAGRRTLRFGASVVGGGRGAGLEPGGGADLCGHAPWCDGARRPALPLGSSTGDCDVWDDGASAGCMRDAVLEDGLSYLTSPFLFEHGVGYEGGAPGGAPEPSVALMCRFAFLVDLPPHVNHLRDHDMLQVARVATEGLRASAGEGQLRMPALAEVAELAARLEQGAPAGFSELPPPPSLPPSAGGVADKEPDAPELSGCSTPPAPNPLMDFDDLEAAEFAVEHADPVGNNDDGAAAVATNPTRA